MWRGWHTVTWRLPISDKPFHRPIYNRAAGGFLAAHVGDKIFAMMPGRDGFYLASRIAPNRSLMALTATAFTRHGGTLADEAAFLTAEHEAELEALNTVLDR